jgi:hypothetical protein
MRTEDLLTYLFDGRSNLLFQPMAGWLGSSRRFAAFATAFRDKIRKKIRTTHDPKSVRSLQLELQTAYLLLREPSLSLEYEPEQSKGARSPDFGVTFTTSLTFMLEVTRVQTAGNMAAETPKKPPASPPGITSAYPPAAARLADAVAGKLGQLLPQCGNILLVAIEAPQLIPSDVRNAMFALQQLAERSDAMFLQAHGFPGRADFFRHYRRLSEVFVQVTDVEAARSMVAWINPQAKYPLPSRVRTTLQRSLST